MTFRDVRLVMRCDAVREDGLGHVMRSLVLAEAFRERGWRPQFATAGVAENMAVERIRGRGFEIVEMPARVAAPGDAVALAALLDAPAGKPAVVVVDSKRADAGYLSQLLPYALVVAIDDDACGPMPADIIVNARMDASPAFYPDLAAERTLLLGPGFNLVHPDHFAVARGPAEAIDRLLVTFGGEDPENHSLWVLEQLLPELTPVAVDVVIGPSHPAPDSIRRMAATAPAIEPVEQPPSLLPLIRRADLAISAGGTTAFELCAARVPMLAIAIEEHQHPLIDPLGAAGAASTLAYASRFDVEAALTALGRLRSSRQLRDEMRASQMRLMALPGACNIVAAVEKKTNDAQKAER
ncbi:MAG TPA: UDP-2,4-diacetamido-2,4,6-trideoxy-beta-L-altropyranose hydrolase [Hyphomicrobiales bacterium]|nr:UDP-2,4-diacetamido-2,4,6-trideoxy-beta-L-altropyranose hydrolase [Hyphomicrobiales bacterium]